FGAGRGDGVGAGAGGPAAAVDAAFEGRAGLGGAEAEAGCGVVRGVGGIRVDGRVGRGEVDGPGVGGRRRIRVPGSVGGAHIEGVAAFTERGRDRVGAGARSPAAAVHAALEGRTETRRVGGADR